MSTGSDVINSAAASIGAHNYYYIILSYRSNGGRYMPKVLHRRYKKDGRISKKLKEVFEQFHKLDADDSHYVSKFLEVYEKDKMCGHHLFPLKRVSS